MRRSRLAFVTGLLGVAVASCTALTNLDGFTCGANCEPPDPPDAPLGVGDAPRNEASTLDTSPPPVDGGIDARTDAPTDANVVDALAYACGATSVSDCATCTGSKFPCVLCDSNGADVTRLLGICVTSPSSGSACQGKGPGGYDDCLCAPPNPGKCPEAYQVCLASGSACRTCGWAGGAGLTCQGGGVCSAAGVCE